MIIAVLGAVNGNVLQSYSMLLKFIGPHLNINIDWVLCVGSFGVWPDAESVDTATKKKGVGDFPQLYVNKYQAPIPTVFVAGPHEDHKWLKDRSMRGNLDVLPNVTWLMNGFSTTIGTTEQALNITGLGKVYSPNHYLKNGNPKYYTYNEVQRACASGPADILLAHEGVLGRTYGDKKCQAKGLKEIIYATRPKIIFHGHYNHNEDYEVMGVPAYSLANGAIELFKYSDNQFKRIG